jgi:hypothetical protein
MSLSALHRTSLTNISTSHTEDVNNYRVHFAAMCSAPPDRPNPLTSAIPPTVLEVIEDIAKPTVDLVIRSIPIFTHGDP